MSFRPILHSIFGSSGFRVGNRGGRSWRAVRGVEIELPAVKEDGYAIVREAAVAASIGLRQLNGRIGCFRHGIGDAVFGVGEQAGQMTLQGLGGIDDRLQTRVRRPEVPAIEELPGPRGVMIGPEVDKGLLDRPGATDLQRIGLEFAEVLA